MKVVGKSDPVTRAKRDVDVKDGSLMGPLETDSEVQNEKGHVEEHKKDFSGNGVVLEGEVNVGKLCLVDDIGSGGLGLSSGVVADLMDDGFSLRMTRFKSCVREKLLDRGGQDFGRAGVVKVFGLNLCPDQEVLVWELKNSWLDCLRYSEEGGDCGASEWKKQLLIWRAQILMTTGKMPMSQRVMGPGI
ncbi:hypothetical protein AVEN_24204-1 [Araneus ventricosus]|uniref:Uncharacterized protein n=1 Tax=Araneus ventricosus TaxID=182803 RepID=A0A4Y2GX22_ARAVE|nr:hypothetical protein AVEN_24204-1 [Araneus ventricosus]